MKYVIVYVLSTFVLSGQVMITEVMYNPAGSDSPNEFVEIFNHSDTTVILTNWSIKDISATDNFLVTDQTADISLAAGAFAVIVEGDYDGIMYQDIIPDSSIIIYVGTTTIGNILGNTADSLFLCNEHGDTVSIVGWNQAAPAGYSWEKIELLAVEAAANWGFSRDSLGTPGRINSLQPLSTDGAIIPDSTWHTPVYPCENQTVTLHLAVANIGITPFSSALEISADNTPILTAVVPLLAPRDTLLISLEIGGFTPGPHYLHLRFVVPGDQDTINNLASDTIQVSYPFGTLQINEFLAQPASGKTEFVELYSFQSINLKNWGISDNSKTIRRMPAVEITADSYILISPDSSYLPDIPITGVLIVPETSWPTLNNSADAIYIFDNTGMLIDSLIYDQDWTLEQYRSCEKLRPQLISNKSSNWHISIAVAGATPGRKNSIFTETRYDRGSVAYTPNPFFPLDPNPANQLTIHYQLPFELAIVKLEIFDTLGRSIVAPYWNIPVAGEGILTWDGNNKNGERVRVGLYILKFSVRDRLSSKTWEDVQTIAVAVK
ncbi:MAG: lamin tail domain-containing protein [Candidatus Marinimicrobia bacterium]|nr:lamin tail domain-containing protein [Candidatus Neomarinimicrobiota bacterium]